MVMVVVVMVMVMEVVMMVMKVVVVMMEVVMEVVMVVVVVVVMTVVVMMVVVVMMEVVVVVVVVVKRYLLGQGLLCVAHLYELDRESLAAAASGYKGTPSWLCYMRLCYGCCVSQQRDYVMAAVPARRE